MVKDFVVGIQGGAGSYLGLSSDLVRSIQRNVPSDRKLVIHLFCRPETKSEHIDLFRSRYSDIHVNIYSMAMIKHMDIKIHVNVFFWLGLEYDLKIMSLINADRKMTILTGALLPIFEKDRFSSDQEFIDHVRKTENETKAEYCRKKLEAYRALGDDKWRFFIPGFYLAIEPAVEGGSLGLHGDTTEQQLAAHPSKPLDDVFWKKSMQVTLMPFFIDAITRWVFDPIVRTGPVICCTELPLNRLQVRQLAQNEPCDFDVLFRTREQNPWAHMEWGFKTSLQDLKNYFRKTKRFIDIPFDAHASMGNIETFGLAMTREYAQGLLDKTDWPDVKELALNLNETRQFAIVLIGLDQVTGCPLNQPFIGERLPEYKNKTEVFSLDELNNIHKQLCDSYGEHLPRVYKLKEVCVIGRDKLHQSLWTQARYIYEVQRKHFQGQKTVVIIGRGATTGKAHIDALQEYIEELGLILGQDVVFEFGYSASAVAQIILKYPKEPFIGLSMVLCFGGGGGTKTGDLYEPGQYVTKRATGNIVMHERNIPFPTWMTRLGSLPSSNLIQLTGITNFGAETIVRIN
jgi:hypothetical protein